MQNVHSFVTAAPEVSARSVSGDIEASNGVIHIIERVLLPARI